MKTASNAEKLSNNEANPLLYLIKAKADGKPAWYYLIVDADKHQEFKKNMATGILELANYGNIIYSGWGEHPPDPIEALVTEKYSPKCTRLPVPWDIP